MHNLRNTHRSVLWSKKGSELTATAWDVATDSVICTFGPTKDNILVELKRWYPQSDGSMLKLVAAWDVPCPLPDLECDRILNLHHFSGSSMTCLVLEGGDIIVVREYPHDGEQEIEIMGSVDVGITAASWSPDEELLAVTTRADTLLYMTREFESVTDAVLLPDDLDASKHVSVGWGKSETQFKGRGAKALRDPTMPEKIDQGIQSPQDDGTTTISWRGDGAYVAVNSRQASHRRVIRVYSREGLLDGVSEPVDAMEQALSWRPAGNLLAAVQRLEDRIEIVFVERNGLRHGQFVLRLSKADMETWGAAIDLKWNADSSILAVCFIDRVQLWTMGNYHYYLKQEIRLPSRSTTKRPALFSWHPEQPLLCDMGSEASLQRLEFVTHIALGSTSAPGDSGIVAVVDGKTIKLTALRYANIPPPMCLHELNFKANIVDISIFEGFTGSNMVELAVLDQLHLSIYDWDPKTKPVQSPRLVATQELSLIFKKASSGSAIAHQQVLCVGDGRFLILTSDINGSAVQLLYLKGTDLALGGSSSQKHLQRILARKSRSSVVPYLQTFGGMVIESDLENFSIETPSGLKSAIANFPKQTSKVELIEVELAPNTHGLQANGLCGYNTIAFGLSDHGSLYANGRCLAKDCTSFLVTSTHLIFTTTQNLLKFIHMTTVDGLEVPPDTPELDERCRSIERGAKLITAMPSISALVLQMPRGNLETIYPRALVLAAIRLNINDKEYKKAFLSCRSQRVDMNILHDHDSSGFLANVETFIDQVKKVEYIDLFLSQLREEDVSRVMYKETVRPTQSHEIIVGTDPNAAMASKVNTICDAFLAVLQHRASTNLQNIITAHVCKIPPDLSAGLLHVAKLQKEAPERGERAVEHICFLVDVNKLYDNALGLYDLDLVLLVAQQSQKDPREYLPFLQNLQGLSILRRKYTIDDHLKRYTKALRHLHDLNVFEEFKSYMAKHALYEEALLLYRYQEEYIRGIMERYASYLQDNSKFKDAGIAYEYLKDFSSAYESYRLAHLWKESLSCANLVPLEEAQLKSLARMIAESLVETKEYFSAAVIHTDYLHDVEAGARLFCQGYFFSDAIRILCLHRRTAALESVVDIGLVEGMGAMTELLAECKAQINAQVPRLQELRIKKAEEPMAFYDIEVDGGTDIPDNVSLAPTDASTAENSLFTRYTNQTGTVGTSATRRTSKNRRREERKRARGKKGSVYEEEYLVNSIGRLIDRVNAVGNEVSRLVTGLMRRGMTERAKAVEVAMVELVGLCKGCVKEVFGSDATESKEKNDVQEEMKRPIGGDGVLWDSMAEMHVRKEAPLIKDFERLSLLGGQGASKELP